MKFQIARQNRRLLFRSYLVMVGGLVIFAGLLDLGFQHLLSTSSPAPSQWVDSNLDLIELHLSQQPEEQWPAAVDELESKLGFAVRILPSDHVVQQSEAQNATQEVFDAQGRSAFVRHSVILNSVMQIGPVTPTAAAESWMVRLIPPLFYLSIFIFVGLWLRPLIRDLNLLSDSAKAFAADYRQPISTLGQVSSLSDLAGSFDAMSTRIRRLIQGQKDLTGALSHEMRTPLTRIRFAMAMIGDKAQFSDELKSINQDVQEIDLLIATMLDYARLDHSDMEISPELTPMNEWLEQVVNKARPSNPDLRIEHHAAPEQVQIDPYLMELAVSSLLVNACRYASTQVQVSFATTAGQCELTVDDDGPGIPEADRKTVFKAFTRLDSSRNRETGGYGLGLAIVARIAALHGGTVHAEESPQGGARIAINWMCQALIGSQ